jgi:hypothetical protein
MHIAQVWKGPKFGVSGPVGLFRARFVNVLGADFSSL